MELAELRTLVEQQAALMVAVATGGPKIEPNQPEYQERRREIAAELRRRGLPDPNPYGDLWQWYGYWSSNLAGWAPRRQYISELYQPVLDAIDHLDDRQVGAALQKAETGWERVDNQLAQLRKRFATARTTEDFQAVGLLCRDILLSLAEATFDEEKHVQEGAETPGTADAKQRLAMVVDVVAAGASNQELRALLRASFDLANKVQHARAGTLDEAALTAEATVASVNLMRVLVLGATPIEPQEKEARPSGLI